MKQLLKAYAPVAHRAHNDRDWATFARVNAHMLAIRRRAYLRNTFIHMAQA